MRKQIPNDIASDEIIVRGIITPFYYSRSKNKLKKEAFLPPRGRNDISTFRLRYTTANFCKNHASKLGFGDNNYCGLAIILHQSILDITMNISENRYENGEIATLIAVYSPLDEQQKLIVKRPVFTTDKGNPAHADLVYNFRMETGRTAPAAVKRIANALAKQPPAKYFSDPFPKQENWNGEMLKF